MAFDFKRAYREFYLPPAAPQIIEIPPMNFLAVRGRGDPNEEGGAYKDAVRQLYAVAYTIRMSRHHRMEGRFDYVVPPLEGLWRQEGTQGIDRTRKESFRWISLIRLPEFVTPESVAWAAGEAERKKKLDCSAVKWFSYTEGTCVQCMHVGSYDGEPGTIAAMEQYARERGWLPDTGERRWHHEIYLSDPRRCAPEKRRTVIRQPVRRAERVEL